jgi:hypothetical protein
MDLKNIDPTVLATLIAITSSGIGAVTVALFGVLKDRSSRRAEERKIIYDIAGRLAEAQWKLDVERTDAFNKELKDGGVFRVRSGLSDFQVPIPHVAHTVSRIIREVEEASRPKTFWVRFQERRHTCKNKKAQQAVGGQPPSRPESKPSSHSEPPSCD